MDGTDALEKLTKGLSGGGGSVHQTKLLMEFQLRGLPVPALLNNSTTEQFLNTVAQLPTDLSKFIRDYRVFALVRAAYFLEPPSSIDPLEAARALGRLVDILSSQPSQNTAPAQPPTSDDTLNNCTLLKLLAHYADQIAGFKTPALPPVPPGIIGLFTCVEQMYHACFQKYWAAALPPMWILTYDPPTSPLQDWLIVAYGNKEGLLLPSGIPSEEVLAKTIVTEHHELFVSRSNSTETAVTMPVSKERALAIYRVFAKGEVVAENTPILAFTDVELSTLKPHYLFIYDFIIEALCKSYTYSCTQARLESFLSRGIDFMTDLGQYLDTATSGKQQLTHSQIKEIKYRLLSCGLSASACDVFRTVIMTLPYRPTPNLDNLSTFMGMVHQLTMFGHYFYRCLGSYSPTGLAFTELQKILTRASAEQTERNPWRHPGISDIPLRWKISRALAFFVPPAPINILQRVYAALPSQLMRAIFEISVKTTWGGAVPANLARDIDTGPNTQHISSTPPPTLKDVETYCQGLRVGDTEYDEDIVRSPLFADAFTKSHLLPILREVLENRLQKNRALFQIRWLIIFAAEAATGLIPARRPLARAYFHIMDILEERHSQDALYNLLDCVQELFTHIRQAVPDAQCPHAFLQSLFVFQFRPFVLKHQQGVTLFLDGLQTSLPPVISLANLGDKLCRLEFEYDSEGDFVRVPVAPPEQPPHVHLSHFKKTIQTIEQATREATVAMTTIAKPIYPAYIRLLQRLEYLNRLNHHILRIPFPQDALSELQETYLAAFARLTKLAADAANTCSYSLTKYFGVLFQHQLVPTAIVKKLLHFDEAKDTTEAFLQSLAQPVVQGQRQGAAGGSGVLTQKELELLNKINPQFTDAQANIPPSIKRSYSNKYDVPEVSVDWETYSRSAFEAPDDELRFVPLTLAGLRKLFVE